jgi:predicted DNA-binding transcriptional regulator AlpA
LSKFFEQLKILWVNKIRLRNLKRGQGMLDITRLIERGELLTALGVKGKALWRAIQRREFPPPIKKIGRKQYWNRDVTTWGIKGR